MKYEPGALTKEILRHHQIAKYKVIFDFRFLLICTFWESRFGYLLNENLDFLRIMALFYSGTKFHISSTL